MEHDWQGAATHIHAAEFDKDFFKLSGSTQSRIEAKVFEMSLRLQIFSHIRLKGADSYRLRIGEYRVIYQFDIEENEIYLIAVGHRRDIYR